MGSSPRERGKHPNYFAMTPQKRLIPAGAGKTDVYNRHNSKRRAHPRVSGENLATLAPSTKIEGSSPRERGKLGRSTQRLSALRLIPA